MRVHVGRLLGGFVCLAAALLLAVLAVVLPAGKVTFMMGGTNMPYVPVVGLALLGLWQLLAAWGR
jgi:hypothetical protein